MATPPRAPHSAAPAHKPQNDKQNAPRPEKHEDREHDEDDAPKGKSAAPKDEQPKYPVLEPDKAYTLFYNGHKIAKDGDPPEKWISMGRLGDSTAVIQSPLTQEMTEAIKTGQWYLADQEALNVPQPPTEAPTEAPTVVDVPYVSANGQQANCTMGNWKGEPTSYAYAWQRDGEPISGATSADYTMVSADSGEPIGCIVTATNGIGSTTAPLSNTVVAP